MKEKILHIISNSGLGGAQSIVRDLVISQQNHYVYTFFEKDNCFKNIKNKTFYFSIKNSYKFNFRILINLYKLIKKENFKVLHLHLVKPLMYASLIKIFIPKLKIIYHEHGLIYASDKTGKTPFWYIPYLNFFKNKIDYVIAISKIIEEKYIKNTKIKREKIKLIYNYVNVEKYSREKITKDIKEKRKKLKLNDDDFVIGFAGRLIKRKGWMELLESAILLKDKRIKFLIAGIGPDKEKMLNFIKENNLEEKTIYLGYINNMVWFYSLLDCFVISSHWEPMGLTHIEAQSMKVPVIVSNVPALNETIQDKKNGLFFASKDSNDLADKIKIIYENKVLRDRISENSFKNANSYSLEKYIVKLNKIYYENN